MAVNEWSLLATTGDQRLSTPAGRIEMGSIPGPASYPTGGFVVDLSSRYTSVIAMVFQVEVLSTVLQTLPLSGVMEVAVNNPSPGKVRVKLYRTQVVTLSEVPAGTDCSGTVFMYVAFGQPI